MKLFIGLVSKGMRRSCGQRGGAADHPLPHEPLPKNIVTVSVTDDVMGKELSICRVLAVLSSAYKFCSLPLPVSSLSSLSILILSSLLRKVRQVHWAQVDRDRHQQLFMT